MSQRRQSPVSALHRVLWVICLLATSIECLKHHPNQLQEVPVLSEEEIQNPQTGPIIGVYTQETYQWLAKDVKPQYLTTKSVVLSNIVNYIKMSGARVVAVSAFRNQSYYDYLLPRLNGFVFTGGAGLPDDRQVYTQNARYIFDYARQQNDKGVHYPLWGSCLGLQFMMFATSEHNQHLFDVVEGNLGAVKNIRVLDDSAIFKGVSKDLRFKLASQNKYIYFHHRHAILPDTIRNSPRLSKFWEIEAYTRLDNGDDMVSAVRAKHYPFYAVAFHFENSVFNWQGFHYPHYIQSIRIAHELSLMFVFEARKNPNRFESARDFMKYSIDACETVVHWSSEYLYFLEEPDGVDRSKSTGIYPS